MNCHHVCKNTEDITTARGSELKLGHVPRASTQLPGNGRGKRTERTFSKSGGDKRDVSSIRDYVPSPCAEGIFMTFPTVAFAYRLHLSHTLFKAIPKSIGLGRHREESRSGVLKLQMSVRRHSVIFPFDHPHTELDVSTITSVFLLQSPGNKGLRCAPPRCICLKTQLAKSFGQILLSSQTRGALLP